MGNETCAGGNFGSMAMILVLCRQPKARGSMLLYVKNYPRVPTQIA